MNKDELYFYNRGFNDCLAKSLNPVKELTDEEILDSWNDEWIVLGKDEKFIKFARAILRKAQEK